MAKTRSRLSSPCTWIAVAFSLLPLAAVAGQERPAQRAQTGSVKQIATLTTALRKTYGVRFVYKAADIPKCSWKITFTPAATKELNALARYMRIFDQEFRKYPPAFIEKSRLKAVAFGKGLSINRQKRAALPDYAKETLYLDFLRGRENETYQRHVVHHEFYHMLEEEWNGDAYFKDPSWTALNPEGFRYGHGGARTQTAGAGAINHPRKGFLNVYAMSAVEEDKAEVWAVLFVPREWRKVKGWLAKDTVLKRKVAFLEAVALAKCKQMDRRYWQRVRQVAVKKTPKKRPKRRG